MEKIRELLQCWFVILAIGFIGMLFLQWFGEDTEMVWLYYLLAVLAHMVVASVFGIIDHNRR